MAHPRQRSGRYRHHIVIQQVTNTDDGDGGYTEAWTTFHDARGSVQPVFSQELVRSDRRTGETTHLCRLRYVSGISKSMRVSYDSRLFDITGMRNIDERRRELELTLREHDPL